MPTDQPHKPRLPADRWITRARPGFLYALCALLLWAIPVGLVAAIRPRMAHDMATAMAAYLSGLPDALYALMGSAYLGYTAARQWGKAQGTDA